MWRNNAAALLLVAAVGCHAAGHCIAGEDLSADECAALVRISLPPTLPKGIENEGAATLGFQLFYDARLSGSQDVRCATCHQPERAFADGLPRPQARGEVPRNTPSLLNAARMSTFPWDGSIHSIGAQSMVPLENPAEMNYSRLELAHRLVRSYAALYAKAFGALPDLSDPARFPARGKPGDDSWKAMSKPDRDLIDAIAANVGQSFEAYLRKVAAGPSRVDRYLGGDKTALSADEAKGLGVLARANCLSCHSGPMLSDELTHDEQIRTPPLRNLTRTAPYGHDGRFGTLEKVVESHGAGATLSTADRTALVATLKALDGEPPRPPWNSWPQN